MLVHASCSVRCNCVLLLFLSSVSMTFSLLYLLFCNFWDSICYLLSHFLQWYVFGYSCVFCSCSSYCSYCTKACILTYIFDSRIIVSRKRALHVYIDSLERIPGVVLSHMYLRTFLHPIAGRTNSIFPAPFLDRLTQGGFLRFTIEF